MEAKLIIVGGKADKQSVALRLPTVIGRSREAGLTVAHPLVSRRHCEIYEVDGLLMIRDLGSLNGTMVGGQRISQSPLCPDCEFTVGPLTFRAEYEYDGDLDAVPATVLANKEQEPPKVESDEEIPDFEAIGQPEDVVEVDDFEQFTTELLEEEPAEEPKGR